jgi:HD-GYP domain-containing protein (c-di-GMP phosphodiesterase class II)
MLYAKREAAARETREALRSTVRALALAVDAKDAYTAYHSDRVTLYALAIGIELELQSDRLERLCTAAQLHDVGKLAIPDDILLKPDGLTEEEFETMKGHSAAGERIVATAGMPEVAVLIRHHHERHDGHGYPDGLSDGAIPLESRILTLADSLDAMTSHRSYSDSMTPKQAIGEIASGAGTQFDPDIAATMIWLLDRRTMRPELAVPADFDELVAHLPNDAWVAELRHALLNRSAVPRVAPERTRTPEALASF